MLIPENVLRGFVRKALLMEAVDVDDDEYNPDDIPDDDEDVGGAEEFKMEVPPEDFEYKDTTTIDAPVEKKKGYFAKRKERKEKEAREKAAKAADAKLDKIIKKGEAAGKTYDLSDDPDQIFVVKDPITGKDKKIKGRQAAKEYLGKRELMAKKRERDKDQYDKVRSTDKKKVDPLRDRTQQYGGLDFDKFFADILAGKKLLRRGVKSPEGSMTFKQIAAIQSLYNDMEFIGRPKKYDKIDVDGKFGPQTKNAIKDLQEFAKTMKGGFKNTKVDGIVGRQTIGLFDPSKTPLPITGASMRAAIQTGQSS